MTFVPLQSIREAVRPRRRLWMTYRVIVRAYPQTRGPAALLAAAALMQDEANRQRRDAVLREKHA